MKKILSIVLAGVLAAGSIGIAVSALSNNSPFGNLNRDAALGSGSKSGAFVGSVMQKESADTCHSYYLVPGTGERLPLKVMTMTSADDDDDRLEAEHQLGLQITSLNAILDKDRINGIPEEAADLTRRLHAALIQAGSLEAFMDKLPAGGIEKLQEIGFDSATHTVFAMFNLQPNATLRAKLGEGGKLCYHVVIPGMEVDTPVELLFMDSMTTGMMLDPTISRSDPEHDDSIIDVESPTVGTLFVIVNK